MKEFGIFFIENAAKILELLLEHVGMTFLSLFLAVIVAIPLGILAAKRSGFAAPLLSFAGILQTVPSIALLGVLLPIVGIGMKPAICALFLYALLPIIQNTYTSITQIDESITEAAKGMGMSSSQILMKVEFPLSVPVIFAGIRTATVINVGVAALAAYIGAGGLGEFIFGGIALNNSNMIIAGAFPAAVLAIILDRILERMQRALQDRSFRLPLLMVLVMFGFIFYAQSSTLANDHLTLAIDPEFYGRKDGYKAIQDAYGLKFNTVIMSSTLMYEALNNQEVDLIAGYATDGRIKAYNLNVLEDDGHAFPPYECVPLVNRRIIEDYPDVIQVLDKLCGMISNKVITHLNYQVDYLKKLPNEVAETFLKTSNLLATSKLPPTGKSITIGSKMFTEQYILAEVFAQLLENQTGHEIIRTPGLGGTKVCFEALRNEEIDIYPEYTGTGLQVILDTPKSVGKRVRADPDSVFNHVKEEFSGQFNIHWTCPLGFNNTYAIMGREKLMGIEVDKVSELMLNQTF